MEIMAKDFKADKKLTVSGVEVYIGTSGKGPQSVLFTKNNLLILIVSSDKLTDDQWVQYISTLM
jgi:hypothetical protein